jgi:hypothetical protein
MFTLFILPAVLSVAHAVTPAPAHAYLGSSITLDGILEPSEWADATLLISSVGDLDPGFSPVTNTSDLDIQGYVKHDGERLLFGFNITDDLLYYIQTPQWLPAGNPSAENLTRAGWPWYGDEMEILINAPNTWTDPFGTVSGTPGVFQMVCNLHKSRLGGLGAGGLLEGEPRSSLTAWLNYQQWIYSRAMQCAVHAFPGAGAGGGNVYGMEWSMDFFPLLQTSPGVCYNTSAGSVPMGLNVALGDTDTQQQGDKVYGLRHEMWWSGNTSCSNHGNCHTLLSYFGTLVMEPEAKP